MAAIIDQLANPYRGKCIILPTKHSKSISIAPHFSKLLGAGILEYVIDTDTLGTFTGEVERTTSALECARKKCEMAFALGAHVEFALASEGTFGPDPLLPFMPCNQEILYFIDRKRDFHLHLAMRSNKTNYRMASIKNVDELKIFVDAVQFPSHAIIMRPDNRESKIHIVKGICSEQNLLEAFNFCMENSATRCVHVETDMRAHYNPSRLSIIGELAHTLATRLCNYCAKCGTPGWGKVREEPGLTCSWCRSETKLVKSEIYGCVKCAYEETFPRADGILEADPGNCELCNP